MRSLHRPMSRSSPKMPRLANRVPVRLAVHRPTHTSFSPPRRLNALNRASPFYTVRGLFPLEQTPGVISLLAGKPNAALFPFTSVQFTAPSRAASDGDGSDSDQTLLKVDDDLLAMGLQYAPTSGIPPMVEWLTDFQVQEHARRRSEGWRVSVTAGSQDAIYKVRRDILLCADASVLSVFPSLIHRSRIPRLSRRS
jgi:hypothetical protein